MDDVLSGLLASQRGHYRFESGLHGDLWLDLDGLFWRPALLTPLVHELAGRVRRLDPEVVCGPLLGGALLAYRITEILDVPFVAAAKEESPVLGEPGAAEPLFSARYRLPPAVQPRLPGLRAVVVDDVINAGSAVRSTVSALRAAGAQPVGLAALVRLGNAVLPYAAGEGLPVETLTVQENSLWPPGDCPLCRSGTPLLSSDPGTSPTPGTTPR